MMPPWPGAAVEWMDYAGAGGNQSTGLGVAYRTGKVDMEDRLSLDLKQFVLSVDDHADPKFKRHLVEALNWLGKRHAYSHEYFRLLKRHTSRKNLHESLFMQDHGVRIRYESAALAFLQNVHAACDAFPFALNVLLGGITKAGDDYDHLHFKWQARLVSDVEKKYPDAVELHLALRTFMEDRNFLMLAALVNQAKHKFFPSLLCKLDTATDRYSLIISDFEYFAYVDGNRQAHLVDGLNVLQFARELHNVTLLKIFELYQVAYRCVTD